MTARQIFIPLAAAICLAALLFLLRPAARTPVAQAADPQQAEATPAHLREEIEHLKQLLPDQAHAMHDVSYHFTNLWFAAANENWPLAKFYFGETKSHLQWAVRMKPKRKDAQDREIDLVAILQAVENTPLKKLADAIEARDREQFEKAYRFTLEEGCYICHKAADKPYLRPQVPTAPETQIINFDPQADWPK